MGFITLRKVYVDLVVYEYSCLKSEKENSLLLALLVEKLTENNCLL